MSLIARLAHPNLTPPVLSVGFAVGASTLFTLSYVASLYLSPAGRLVSPKHHPNPVTLDRDHPIVIRARIKTASLATCLTVLATGVVLWFKGAVPSAGWLLDTLNITRLLGLPLPTPTLLTSHWLPFNPSLSTYLGTIASHILSPLLLTSVLFLGPLYISYLDAELPFQSGFSFHRHVVIKFTSLVGIRNYLVGPFTEELVFRSCILTPLIFAQVSRKNLIFTSPIFFGFAHIHHAYHIYLQGQGANKRQAIKKAALTATIQFVYTMVFGWYANFLFLRSATVCAPLTAHIFCNIMGLPSPSSAAQRHTKSSAMIWTTHAVGIVLFARFLFPLTSPSLLGGSLYWPSP